jgi:ElaB/YqjD/DUF883 family membrane-anchored ribosome-binding protein
MAVPLSTGQRNELEPAMTIEQTRDQIVDQFSSVLTEAENLLSKATHETGEKARDLRSQAESRLLTAKLKLQELQGQAVDRAKDAAKVTDDYVHENPWQAIGIAAAVGLVAGLLMNRR